MKRSLLPVQHSIVANVSLPGSKSMCNRSLLLAALARGVSKLNNMLFSDDVNSCIQALKDLGVNISVDTMDGLVVVEGCSGVFPSKKAFLKMNDAGTLTRFLIPLCAAQLEGVYHFSGSTRMMERPILELMRILENLGAHVEYLDSYGCMPFILYAKGLNGGEVEVCGDKSSQFLSGLLLAAPYARSTLKLISKVNHSQPYVLMTVSMMDLFGVKVKSCTEGYQVASGCYFAQDYIVEPDISTASYFWAVAAITKGKVRVLNTKFDSLQGDIRFLSVLEKMGCRVSQTKQGIMLISERDLKGVSVNMREFSDTFMTVLSVAVFADGPTYINGLAHTRLQESDRIEAISEGLTRLGVSVKTTSDSIEIYPDSLHGNIVSGCNDHRIAMSLALVGLKVPGVVIDGAECVSKTCPDYFKRMSEILV
jgi:3-phosphoshikimate 1-carboxyvinyltransferase